ncbi:MAG: hypothetical protein IJ796_00145 [Lachnospiraceae bacterium]|nr:hypothetical protein [Lachnospiraceae bacterium]
MMNDNDTEYRKEKMTERRIQVEPLAKYLPWFEQASQKSAASMYSGNGLDGPGALTFPVYDPTLMSFIKIATNSPLMDRNYQYVYTRKGIRDAAGERNIIASADYRDWDTLCGILSKYVLGGRTKGILWSQGVSERIFFLCLTKMLDIVTEWNAERNLR